MMSKKEDEQQIEISLLPLAAALLAVIPSLRLQHVSKEPGKDGKRTFRLIFPIDQESALKIAVNAFNSRELCLNLYSYNLALNYLRDQLFKPEYSELSKAPKREPKEYSEFPEPLKRAQYPEFPEALKKRISSICSSAKRGAEC